MIYVLIKLNTKLIMGPLLRVIKPKLDRTYIKTLLRLSLNILQNSLKLSQFLEGNFVTIVFRSISFKSIFPER